LRCGLLRVKGSYPREVSTGALRVHGQSVADWLDNDRKHDRNSRSGMANRSHRNRPDDGDEFDAQANHFGGEFRQPLQLSFGCSDFKPDAFAFNPSKVPKLRLEAVDRPNRRQ
jgi:hypothetical protein